MARTFICYEDNIYGHMLGAIAGKYVKDNFPNEQIEYWPNWQSSKTVNQTAMIVPKHLGKRDTIYFLGVSPAANAWRALFETYQPKRMVWYDCDSYVIDRAMNACYEEMKNLPDVEGYRSNNFDLGARLWKDLFPEKKVPPCINWIDSYYQGNPNASARAFVHGLELLETCPKDLESHPDTLSDEEREMGEVASNVWEACFEVDSPANFGAADFDMEAEMPRMRWDATFQIMNMGTIVDTLVRLRTQELIDHDCFRNITLPDGTVALMTNARECDPEVLREMYTQTGCTTPYAGWYYIECFGAPKFQVALVKLEQGESCINVAKKFDHAIGSDDFATFRCDSLENSDTRSY